MENIKNIPIYGTKQQCDVIDVLYVTKHHRQEWIESIERNGKK